MRNRNNNRLDFKLHIGDMGHLYCKETNFTIDEINKENNYLINALKVVGINTENRFMNFKEFVNNNNLVLLAKIKKHRQIYKLTDNIDIIIDQIEDLGTFLEAEMMVEEELIDDIYIKKCKDELINLLYENELIKSADRAVKIGYVELFLKRYNSAIYDMGLFKE